MDENAIYWFGIICLIVLLIQKLVQRPEVSDSPHHSGAASSSLDAGNVSDQVIGILSRTANQDLGGIPPDTELESFIGPAEIANALEEIEDHFAIRLPGSLYARDMTVEALIKAIKEHGSD